MSFRVWDKDKNADYQYIDDSLRELYHMSGLGTLVYRYTGPEGAAGEIPELTIQDFVNMENRDKTWDMEPYELFGIYTPRESSFNLMPYGIFADGDNLTITYHYNDMIEKLSRKIMPDDIIELPNLRDFDPLDPNTPSLPKLYVVTDSYRDADSFSATWRFHGWKVNCKPLTDSQEYRNFLNKEDSHHGFVINDSTSPYGKLMEANDAILAEAKEAVPHRNFTTDHFYIVPGDEFTSQYPWIWAGDGLPPNGAVLAAVGTAFPDAEEGTYFLHRGFQPNVLYRKVNSRWKMIEYDYSKEITSTNRILENFINNTDTIDFPADALNPAETQPQRQDIKKVAKRKSPRPAKPVTDLPPEQVVSERETKPRRKKKPKVDFS